MLIKRKSGEASRSKLQALAAGLASEAVDRRTFLKRSGLAVGGLAAVGLDPARLGAQGRGGRRRCPGAPIEIKKNICTHCSVGCTVTAEVAERRLGRPGAVLGEPDQPRHALRQGRGGARARARRPPPEIPDEARRRRSGSASPGSRRSTRSATR